MSRTCQRHIKSSHWRNLLWWSQAQRTRKLWLRLSRTQTPPSTQRQRTTAWTCSRSEPITSHLQLLETDQIASWKCWEAEEEPDTRLSTPVTCPQKWTDGPNLSSVQTPPVRIFRLHHLLHIPGLHRLLFLFFFAKSWNCLKRYHFTHTHTHLYVLLWMSRTEKLTTD